MQLPKNDREQKSIDRVEDKTGEEKEKEVSLDCKNQCSKYIESFCLKLNKLYKISVSNERKLRAYCPNEGCNFSTKFNRRKNSRWYLIHLKDHLCNINKSRVKSEFIKEIKLKEINRTTTLSGTGVKQICLSDYGVRTPYSTAWLGLKHAKEEINGS